MEKFVLYLKDYPSCQIKFEFPLDLSTNKAIHILCQIYNPIDTPVISTSKKNGYIEIMVEVVGKEIIYHLEYDD